MNDLQRQMDEVYQRKVEQKLEAAVRITAMQIFKQVVLGTPVGNPSLWKGSAPKGYIGGTARQSWNIDINIIDTKITYASTESAQAFDGTDKAMSATARYKLSDTIYIVNALPYVRRLNDGHSTQAPVGFIDSGIETGKRQGKEIANRR